MKRVRVDGWRRISAVRWSRGEHPESRTYQILYGRLPENNRLNFATLFSVSTKFLPDIHKSLDRC